MKHLKKIANLFFYLIMHPVEALLGVGVIGFVILCGYFLIVMLPEATNHQTLIDPRISSYYVTAEITNIKQNSSGETVLEYKVIETDSYKIRVGGTGEMTPINSEMNEVQRADLARVGATLTITCKHESEQMYCKMKTANFETVYTLILYK